MKTELKAHELRVGNLFYYDERIQIVEGVSIKNGGYRIDFKTEGKSKLVKNCKPIPINEEFHNKFGVHKNGFHSFEYEIDNHRVIVFNGDYIFLRQNDINTKRHEDDIVTLWNKDFKRRDIFVHEFQNLYFALTGKELQFNLFS